MLAQVCNLLGLRDSHRILKTGLFGGTRPESPGVHSLPPVAASASVVAVSPSTAKGPETYVKPPRGPRPRLVQPGFSQVKLVPFSPGKEPRMNQGSGNRPGPDGDRRRYYFLNGDPGPGSEGPEVPPLCSGCRPPRPRASAGGMSRPADPERHPLSHTLTLPRRTPGRAPGPSTAAPWGGGTATATATAHR